MQGARVLPGFRGLVRLLVASLALALVFGPAAPAIAQGWTITLEASPTDAPPGSPVTLTAQASAPLTDYLTIELGGFDPDLGGLRFGNAGLCIKIDATRCQFTTTSNVEAEQTWGATLVDWRPRGGTIARSNLVTVHWSAQAPIPTASCDRALRTNKRAEVVAGDASDQAAERGAGPFEQGLAARTAYLAIAPDDICNGNNAFVHSYVAGASRQGGRTYDGTAPEWAAALADGRVATAIAALDQYLGGPGRSGISIGTVTQTGCSNPPC